MQRVSFEIKARTLCKNFKMLFFKENNKQKQIADYSVYIELKQLNYTDLEIAKHLSYTEKELLELIEEFTL